MIRAIFAILLSVILTAAPAPAEDIPPELLKDVAGGTVERAHLVVTGSESMTPFTMAIARRLAARWQIPEPVEQPLGTHAGFLKFCGGIGGEFPDLVAATRRMRPTEFDLCITNGIADIIELPIGFSAVAFVQRRGDPPVRLTPKYLYQALAAEVPQGHDLVAVREGGKEEDLEHVRREFPHASYITVLARGYTRYGDMIGVFVERGTAEPRLF